MHGIGFVRVRGRTHTHKGISKTVKDLLEIQEEHNKHVHQHDTYATKNETEIAIIFITDVRQSSNQILKVMKLFQQLNASHCICDETRIVLNLFDSFVFIFKRW